jgi:hypothetical protein
LVAARTKNGGGGGAILSDYRDPAITDDKPYWGAIQPVVDRRPQESDIDLHWLVLVQEPVERAAETGEAHRSE